MERVAAYSFSLNTVVLKVVGFYPLDRKDFLHRLYSSGIFIVSMLPITSLSILHYVFITDLTSFNYNDFMMVAMVFYTMKFIPFATNSEKMKNCVHYFDDPFFRVMEETHKAILLECVNICRRNSKVFCIGCAISYTGFLAQALLNLHELPLDVWMPRWVKSKPIYFYAEFFLVLLGIAYSAAACGVIDPLIGGLAYQATAQLKILKENLRHIDGDGGDEFWALTKNSEEINRSRKIYAEIRKCVQHHQRILSFVNEYQSCFSPVVFSQFTGSGLLIGLLCFQMSKMLNFGFSAIMTLCYIGCLFFQIFFYCYYGTLLIDESKSLSDAAYLSKWYEFDISSKRALITLMERTKKPMVVTAGKLFDLSLETFTVTLKRAYSLLAVLKNY